MISGIGGVNANFLTGTAGGVLSPTTPAPRGGGAVTGMSFASMVSDTAGRTVDRLKQAEQMSVEVLQGKGDMRETIDAVMSAEQSFQAAVAIRDKIVTAYLEVGRMAI
ncbi:flagellar hook-basal body complex protein FliE [Mesorhizobium sp. ASY16-5R]|uniref:flagellar hook-basal body complex protein FliE n=1 Tax=Mesorhizobium sp. ASY16-5R TaxID=3445772 RepID=UPI003F9EDB4B